MVGLRWGSHNCGGFGRETQKIQPDTILGAQREGSAMSEFLLIQRPLMHYTLIFSQPLIRA